ncbi:YciI family protein [Psychromonas sp. GE-S-Ul-11]|uniref:YciI family protein n=1 Tax=Psychromonas sp. GE-S-Ul-11 TaxID=3241170 RepID=UPI00390C7A01
MISWDEYKKEAKERGSLAMEVFIIESQPQGDLELVKQYLPLHLAYQEELEASGKLMLAGPVSDASGKYLDGGGLIIYRASSLEEANQIALNDPMHSHNARTFTIKRWLINEGNLQLNIKLSAQSIRLTADK